MLQSIHDNAKGWIAYLIVFLISIPFALVGISSYFGGGGDRVAATVNGEEIPVTLVRNELQQLKQQFGQIPSFQDDALKQLALDQIIARTLLEQEVEEYGYRASSEAIKKAIREIPAFHKDGAFDFATYQQVLAANRRNEGVFESQIAAELAMEHLQSIAASSSFVPNEEAERYQALKNQQRDLDSFILKADQFKAQIQVTEQDVSDYYQTNQALYMTDEAVKLDYVEVNRDEIANSLTITEDEIQAYYDQNQDRYIVPEKRYASHILIDMQEGKEDEAKSKAEQLYQAIISGEKTFEEVAKTDSSDTFSAEKGGDLGAIVGDWDPSFKDLVYSTPLNQVAEPLKTPTGYEIIKVTKIDGMQQKSFADAKADVEQDMRNEQAADLYQDKDDELPTLAYENETDLAPVATALDIEKKTTDWLTMTSRGDGLLSNPTVLQSAFSEEMKSSGKNSERIDLADGHVAVFRVVDIKPPAQRPLDEVKATIRATLEADKLRQLMQEKGDALLAALQTSQSWSAITDQGLGDVSAVKALGFVDRKSKELPFDQLTQAFAMPKPDQGKSSYMGSLVQGNDYQVIALKGIKNGEQKLDDVLRKGFNLYIGNRQSAMMLQALRDEADVELYPENI